VAGGSAQREWERRRDLRNARVRARLGGLAGVALAVTGEPAATRAWARGAAGERRLGSILDGLRADGIAVLHDRRLPNSRSNIDHLVVCPSGVFVVDAKNYRGRVERRDRGGLFSTDYRLYVGGSDRSGLVAGMARQTLAVEAALGRYADIPVIPTVCFVDADWSLFARPLQFGNVRVLWPRALVKSVRGDGPLTPDLIAQIAHRLELALPCG
jgi:hypothetical protein